VRGLTIAWRFGAAVALCTLGARAGPEDVVLLPTVTPIQETPGEMPVLRRPDQRHGVERSRWARRLDAVLGEAAQDLGLTIDVSGRSGFSERDLGDEALLERASGSWVVSPRLEIEGAKLRVRIVAVAPGSKVILLRVQELEPRELSLRAMVMLRDVVQTGRGAPQEPDRAAPPPDERAVVYHARSQGRAVLALNAAAFGGYVGFSLQRASGESDERLTYPLIALGTGVGLGGSMIIADEWDVGLGDAWFLSAAAWWPTAAGVLIADGYDVEPESERYVYGLVGAAAGVTLATAALSFKGMGEGGATLAHSGGALGTVFGGITQLMIDGSTDDTPTLGMGYGAGAGVLAAGALATQIRVSSSRMLLLDLGVALGGLGGAAAASPLVFGEEVTAGRNRIWLGAIAAGALAGGTISYFVTQPSARSAQAQPPPSSTALPWAGVVAESTSSGGRSVPVVGGGVHGFW
jgi:hypothetical protein